jgi:S1-C subfamily serine protease
VERRRALALAVALLLLAGCTQPAIEQAEVEASQTVAPYQDLFDPPANLSALVDKVSLATYIVDCGRGHGSGWGLTLQWRGATRSFIVTNHHVVAKCLAGKSELTIIDRELNEFSGKVVVAKDREPDFEKDLVRQDLALIEPDVAEFSTLDSLVSGGYPIGSWVMTSSNPGLEDHYYTPAITYGNIAADSVLDGYVITAAVNPGSSGGVVVNSRGEVLGTIWGGNDQSELNDAGYFLPMSNLWSLMGELPVEKDQ